ncbi:MAG: AI-2E family transporter [Xanthobacteraceae bacterium]|nr:MAG: AI-2E family transporter [Xanthobacteraceae bacterium]
MATAPDGSEWEIAERVAIIGIFVLMLAGFLYIARALVAPIVAAAVISFLLGPLAARAASYRIPNILFATGGVILVLIVINAGIMLVAGAVSEWAGRGPEIAEALKTKAHVLERPLAMWREFNASLATMLGASSEPPKFELPTGNMIAGAMNYLTPALGELLLFAGSLFFFLLSRNRQRRIVLMFARHDQRLRALRILNDIEGDLTRYVSIITPINIVLGLITALMMYLLGLPGSILWGTTAAILNYIPYIGPAIMAVNLLVLGLIFQPTLGAAFIAPVLFVGLTSVEGHVLTPKIIGHRLRVSPQGLFLSLAFWTWLWGPIGTFLAMPFAIAFEVFYEHAFPKDVSLP